MRSDAGIEVRRADQRFRTRRDGIVTWHSFSYGEHYDPDNVGFGPVIALNEESLSPGAGYETHRHADVAIHTLVLEGALAHEDSTGRRYVLQPGRLESVSAGEGIEHTERNDSSTERLRFLQLMTRDESVDVQVIRGKARVQGPALVHVFNGEFRLGDDVLASGDEARIHDSDAYDLSAPGPAGALIVRAR